MTAQLQLAYYPGAYGPTIRIDAQGREDLAAVGRLFRRLVSGEDVGVALVAARTPCIRSSPCGKGRNRKALTLHEVVAGLPAFRWSQNGDDWLDHAEVCFRE